MGRIVNQRELSEILGITAKSLSLWQKDGMPVALETENGLSNQYDTEQVIAWYVAREVAKGAKETEKDRLARLQGDKIELEIAEKRHELVPASEIEPAWVSMVLATRQALLSLPARVAPLLAQLDGADPIRELLREEIEDALTQLAAANDDSGAGLDGGQGTDALGTAVASAAVGVGGTESRAA